MNQNYPLLLNLTDRRVLVVGGGQVATRKLVRLIPTGALIKVISPAVTPEIESWAEEDRLNWHVRGAIPQDVESADLVFLASDSPPLNRMLAKAARARRIWVNECDVSGGGDFMVPGEARRGDLRLFVSTSGGSPALARQLREKLEAFLEDGWEPMLEILSTLRLELIAKNVDPAIRARFWRRFPNEAAWQALAKHGFQGVREEARRCVSSLSE